MATADRWGYGYEVSVKAKDEHGCLPSTAIQATNATPGQAAADAAMAGQENEVRSKRH